MSSVTNSVLLQLIVNAGLFKKPTAEGIGLPHKTDSIQPRGNLHQTYNQHPRQPQPYSQKQELSYNGFFQIEKYKVILLCIIFKKFPVKQIFCLNLT